MTARVAHCGLRLRRRHQPPGASRLASTHSAIARGRRHAGRRLRSARRPARWSAHGGATIVRRLALSPAPSEARGRIRRLRARLLRDAWRRCHRARGISATLRPEVTRRWRRPDREHSSRVAYRPSAAGHVRRARTSARCSRSGARVSGATVHFVDEEYDRGAILAQWPVPVLADDTVQTLASRVLKVEHVLYPRVIQAVASRQWRFDARPKPCRMPPAIHSCIGMSDGSSRTSRMRLAFS